MSRYSGIHPQCVKHSTSRRCLTVICFLFAVLCKSSPAYAVDDDVSAGADKDALTLGYFPLISTVALFKRFSPLRDYLSVRLGRPVILETAKDFATFVKRTDDRAYDIVVTAPHFAVRASDSGTYRIRATLVEDVQQLIVVRDDSPITDITQLAGMPVSTPPKRALMTMMGVQHMADSGLAGDMAPIYRAFTSHNAANEALLANEVDAAIASSNIVNKAISQGKPLRIISRGPRLANMATLVAADLDREIGNRVVEILVGMQGNEKGRNTLKQIRFSGYREVNAADYEPARPYMRQGITDLGRYGLGT